MERQSDKLYMQRDNLALKFFFGFWVTFSSYPKLLLEVFLRKNFGKRYMRLSHVIYAVVVLATWPYWGIWFRRDFMGLSVSKEAIKIERATFDLEYWLKHYGTWYLFIALFFIFGIIRYIQVVRRVGFLKHDNVSQHTGDPYMFFFTIGRPHAKALLKSGNLNKQEQENLKVNSLMAVEIFWEPLPFVILGAVLFWIFHQSIGLVLLISGTFYSLGNLGGYFIKADKMQDNVDGMYTKSRIANYLKQRREEMGLANVGRTEVGSRPSTTNDNEPATVT